MSWPQDMKHVAYSYVGANAHRAVREFPYETLPPLEEVFWKSVLR